MKTGRSTLRRYCHVLAACLPGMACLAAPEPQGGHVILQAGANRIEVEMAVTEQARTIGLSHRTRLAPDHGLLLVFPEARQHCLWMNQTHIPLSAAFLDDAGQVVNLEDMQPQTTTRHCAKAPVHFALEMNAGWFARKGIRPGARITMTNPPARLDVE